MIFNKRFLVIFTFLIASHSLFSQNFDYERIWGTYYGPAATDLEELHFDPQSNLNVVGSVTIDNSLPAAYYNQYVTSGGQNVNTAFLFNKIFGNYDDAGNLLASDYRGGMGSSTGQLDYLVHIDIAGGKYYLKSSPNNLADIGTPNAWFINDPITPTTGTYHTLLYKKDITGNIVWKTYLPGKDSSTYSFASDENSNLFVYSSTYIQQGIGTPSVFRENYQLYYNSNNVLSSNAFVSKIGQQGELLWGSYLPTASNSRFIQYHNQNLYLIGGGDFVGSALNQFATVSAWQTLTTNHSLTTLNAQNGTRNWGTYIGSANPNDAAGILGFKINATGIYISGIVLNYAGNSSNYFATTGAYKTQISGDTDYFLTKLNLSGQRIWGTYFGSDGYENIGGSYQSLAITDNAVFLVGSNWGLGNNIATPGAYQDTKPSSGNLGNNMFFAQFNLNGNLNWCSYYGGPTIFTYNQPISISAPNNSTFYLYGSTQAASGIATENAAQPQLPQNLGQYNTGFIARFDYKGGLSTTESPKSSDLILYDNPNNGNFSLKGKVLEKEKTTLQISDAAGRLVYQKNLPRKDMVNLQLEGSLVSGIYFLQVTGQENQNIKTFKMIVKK